MPELPEVETVRRGIAPAIIGKAVDAVVVRRWQLRQPIPADFCARLQGKKITAVERRGKYLLLSIPPETCIIHLGMSGVLSLSALPAHEKHAHVCWELDDGTFLIYTDPRRFGLVTLTQQPPLQHKLLATIGVEPLTRSFSGKKLAQLLANKKTPIKTALMNGQLVAGIGNIYASESLFQAGIHPRTAAGELSDSQCKKLVEKIKQVLRQALRAGGSSMRDFAAADGKPGYFQTQWAVYERSGQTCYNKRCGAEIEQIRQNGRSSYYCPSCQPYPPPEECS